MIAALGASVGQWDVGERVAVVPMVSCGACYACRTGRPNLCENGIDRGPGIGRQGAYAESVTVPVGMLRRLPPAISDAEPVAGRRAAAGTARRPARHLRR